MIHQLLMHSKHIMFRGNDYAASQMKGSIILYLKSESRPQIRQLRKLYKKMKNIFRFSALKS
ncbi:hypothetical protein FDW88_13090 [Citrobacter sp. wls829]|nr:hypothetical protein FDW88_13090 [Citrobacter sp. wls829]